LPKFEVVLLGSERCKVLRIYLRGGEALLAEISATTWSLWLIKDQRTMRHCARQEGFSQAWERRESTPTTNIETWRGGRPMLVIRGEAVDALAMLAHHNQFKPLARLCERYMQENTNG
jgi:hypothetical protein